MSEHRTAGGRRENEIRAIEETAAEWFGRCEIGLTPPEEREFIQWLEADPRHGEAMREMDETWDFLDRLKESDRLRSAGIATFPPRRSSAPWTLVLAAAAAVALAFIGVWQPWSARAQVRFAATEPGGMKKIELPDGSVVHLNASSRIEARYTAEARQVKLVRGEAHFAVSRNPARPFVVTAGDVAVKAVGTAFDVRHADGAVEVFVTEGKVRVDHATRGESLLAAPAAASAAEPPLLTVGHRALVTLDREASPSPAVVSAIQSAEMHQALAWRERQLDFDLTPLAQVAAEFNRYNSHQLVIDDAELGRQPFGGSFRADNYAGFVRLLEQRFGVTSERRDDVTILHRAR